jgi:hypothetical protein
MMGMMVGIMIRRSRRGKKKKVGTGRRALPALLLPLAASAARLLRRSLRLPLLRRRRSRGASKRSSSRLGGARAKAETELLPPQVPRRSRSPPLLLLLLLLRVPIPIPTGRRPRGPGLWHLIA